MEWFRCCEQGLDFNLITASPTVQLLGDLYHKLYHSVNFLFMKSFALLLSVKSRGMK